MRFKETELYKEIQDILKTSLSNYQKDQKIEELVEKFQRTKDVYAVSSKAYNLFKKFNDELKKELKLHSDSLVKNFITTQLDNTQHEISISVFFIVARIFQSIHGGMISENNFKIILYKNFIESLSIVIHKKKDKSIDSVIFKTLASFQLRHKILFSDIITNVLLNLNIIKISEFRTKRMTQYEISEEGYNSLHFTTFDKIDLPKLDIKSTKYNKMPVHFNDDTDTRKKYTNISERLFNCFSYLTTIPLIIDSKDVIKTYEKLTDFLKKDYPTVKSVRNLSQVEYIEKFKRPGDTYHKTVHLRLEYKKIKQIIKQLEDALDTALLYSDRVIYFKVYLDWRGRAYFYGTPLNLYSTELIRALFRTKEKETLVPCDVTASGFQICGLLTGCEKTLKLTQLFEPDSNYKEDIYEYNLKKLIEGCNLENKPYFKKFTRKFYKNLLMCKLYSESFFSRNNKILIFLTECTYEEINTEKCRELTKELDSMFLKENDSLTQLEKFIKKVCKHAKEENKLTVLCSALDHLSTIMIYPQQETIRVSVRSTKDNTIRKVSIKVNKDPFKNDHTKTIRGAVANFIHQNDSYILSKVVDLAKINKIPLFTVHDCFYVREKDITFINELYYEACRDIYANEHVKHPLQVFAEANNYPITGEIKDFIEESKKKTIDLFKKNRPNKNILK